MDHQLIERCQDNHLTVYTAIQVYMAIDEWEDARVDYDKATDEFYAKITEPVIAEFPELSTGLAHIAASQSIPGFADKQNALIEIDDRTPLSNPLTTKMRNHSREAFPVDKAMREAKTFRSNAKKVRKLVSDWNWTPSLNDELDSAWRKANNYNADVRRSQQW